MVKTVGQLEELSQLDIVQVLEAQDELVVEADAILAHQIILP